MLVPVPRKLVEGIDRRRKRQLHNQSKHQVYILNIFWFILKNWNFVKYMNKKNVFKDIRMLLEFTGISADEDMDAEDDGWTVVKKGTKRR